MASKMHQSGLELTAPAQKVTCLGIEFASDDDRRQHFRERLREYLADPTFRAVPNFPQGLDDAIIRMSDPPFYTACPNPFLPEIIAYVGTPYDPTMSYSRAPLAIDVTVGKTDPLYRAHGYHTKVPHQAIVPSILHYTSPGDVVLDGFGGSGMTGVAASFCGTAPTSYRTILEAENDVDGRPAPTWGARHAIINDLSPAASFIAANYVNPIDIDKFERASKRLLSAARDEIGWMYETEGKHGQAEIDFTIWSEVFVCSSCTNEIVFASADRAEQDEGRARLVCPSCSAEARKEELELATEQYLDPVTGKSDWRPRREPVGIVYKQKGKALRKELDEQDRDLIRKVSDLAIPSELPTLHLNKSKSSYEGRMRTTNTQAIPQFFVPRAAHALACLWRLCSQEQDDRTRNALLFGVEQAIIGMSVLNRYSPTHFSQVNRALNGVFYVGSQHSEVSPWYILEGKFTRLISAFRAFRPTYGNVAVSVGSAASIGIPESSIDYIFTDPPFGGNICYSALNFVVEAWHGVITNNVDEAVVDKYVDRSLIHYQSAMQACFSEYFRVLKPGRWMTVVFSNSQASVWNTIQVALQQAGFVVAEVTALDKKQGSFKQVTSTNAIKQDLVVSCYKPNGGLEDRFEERGLTEDTAWDFVRTHLRNLAVVKRNKEGGMDAVAERDPRRVFDRMVAWFVRHNTPVPISSAEFQEQVVARFVERDGMLFLPNQVDDYDRVRLTVAVAPQRELFVDDERSAIDWLSDHLKAKPSTRQDILPEFIKKMGAGWRKHETKPELSDLLEGNFLQYDGSEQVPPQIHGYLSSNWKELRNLDKGDSTLKARARDRWYVPDPRRAQDVERRRERALLKEFETYKAHRGRRLREFRLEVMRAGFKAAYAARDYQTIIDVAEKVTEDAWQEDEKLLTFYELAANRIQSGR
ncbi:DNA methyltransferase [Sphingomonas sp. PvP056]|uniref:DNA methyltransferase n=1 Tax=Sphingomonas sp. PvP056 TaxID=3156392 RepID=UPI0033945CD7